MKFKLGASCVMAIAALVGAPVASATQYVTVQQSAAGTVGGTVDVTATCPAGYVPTGGGWDMYPSGNKQTVLTSWYQYGSYVSGIGSTDMFLPRIDISISRPNDAGDGWRVAGFVNVNTTLYAWARCASVN